MHKLIFFLFFIIIACTESEPQKVKAQLPETPYKKKESTVNIIKRWELPGVLREISGIASIDEKRIACIQDEKGAIFIYNLEKSEIEREIPFHGRGDFEGIALVDEVVYALRSDGIIFKVDDIGNDKPNISTFSMGFKNSQDAEGLCYDKANDRLLVAGKGPDPNFKSKKGIYAYDLKTSKVDKNPAYLIDLKDDKLDPKKKKINKTLNPSEILINPETDEIMISDRDGRLVFMNRNSEILRVVELPDSDFKAVEGMCFDDDGNLYISNEFAGKDPGLILLVGEFK